MTLSSLDPWSIVLAAIAGLVLWLAAWYWDTVASMVSIWYRSETFAHAFLVFPISLWLVWRQRRELQSLRPAPALAPAPLLLMAAAATLWTVAELADVLTARHFAWITLLVAGVWLLTGKDVMRRMWFPLAFLYFAVPMGEFLLPTLIQWTADFTIAAVRASGVPVLRDGMILHLPTGSWSVVEACSGLRYLIASVTVGVLYAYLSYRSTSRRILFVGLSILVPIVANWLRAYMIVMIGHLSGNKLAVGIDHVIYGWVFFGLVMLLLFWVGNLWSEPPDVQEGERRIPEPTNPSSVPRWMVPLGVSLALTMIPPAALAVLQIRDDRGAVALAAPALASWQPMQDQRGAFTPEFTAPRASVSVVYAKGNAIGGIYVAAYYGEDQNSKLVSSRNQLLRTTSTQGHVISEGRRSVVLDGVPLVVDESLLRVRQERVLARTWYWVDGEFTGSDVRAKVKQALGRLSGRGDAGAIVVVWTPLPSRDDPVDVRSGDEVIDDLARQAAPDLRRMLAERLTTGPVR